MKYYHITKPILLKTILKQGLKANEEGHIFLFENKSIELNNVINTIADCIAYNQIFLDKYVMLEINSKGIATTLKKDNVGELSSQLQWIAKQPIIEPNYINFFGLFKTKYKKSFK